MLYHCGSHGGGKPVPLNGILSERAPDIYILALLRILYGNTQTRGGIPMKKILLGFIMDGRSVGLDTYLLHFIDAVWKEGMQIDLLTNEADSELKKHRLLFHLDSDDYHHNQ